MNETAIQSLLDNVAILIKKNDELVDVTGSRFNMFKLCKVNHYENTHSAILAELLNPKGSHGMGCAFLKEFLKTSLESNDFSIVPEKCTIKTEFPTANGRIDILITDEKNAICIENKIYAEDQWQQLQRYNEYLKRIYQNNYKILYLTLGGYDASEQSSEGVEYIPVSYRAHIIEWLEECIKISAEKPIVRETLCQYRNHLRSLTGTNLEKKHMSEVIKVLCKSKENVAAAKEIANAVNTGNLWGEIITPFLNTVLKPLIEEELKLKDLEVGIWLHPYQWAGFSFKLPSWNFSIRFEFASPQHKDMQFGIFFKKEAKSKFPTNINKPEKYTLHGNGNLVKKTKLWNDTTWDVLLENNKENTDYKDLVQNFTDEIKTLMPTVEEYLKLYPQR